MMRSLQAGPGSPHDEDGVLLGMTPDKQYIVYKPISNALVRRRDVVPINELSLALEGLPCQRAWSSCLAFCDQKHH